VDNSQISKNHNGKWMTGRWSKFSYYIKNRIRKIRDKLLSKFINLENSKEYDPGDLGTHNRRMIVDDWYKFAYHFKCIMYKLRYKFLSFLIDVILLIFISISFILFCIPVFVISYMAMKILANPKSFSKFG